MKNSSWQEEGSLQNCWCCKELFIKSDMKLYHSFLNKISTSYVLFGVQWLRDKRKSLRDRYSWLPCQSLAKILVFFLFFFKYYKFNQVKRVNWKVLTDWLRKRRKRTVQQSWKKNVIIQHLISNSGRFSQSHLCVWVCLQYVRVHECVPCKCLRCTSCLFLCPSGRRIAGKFITRDARCQEHFQLHFTTQPKSLVLEKSRRIVLHVLHVRHVLSACVGI